MTDKTPRDTPQNEPYKNLVLATILTAAKDARRGDWEAGAWLLFEGRLLADVCGVDLPTVTDWTNWILSGCPKKILRKNGV